MDGDGADFGLHFGDVAGAQDGSGRGVEGAVEESPGHIGGGLRGGVADGEAGHEAVELGLGEGVGAGHLGGVLGSDDHEGLGNGKGLAVDGDLVFLHDLEEGGLGFGRGAVELVGENDVVDDRARYGLKGALGGVID